MPTGWRRISRAVRGRARSLGSARGPACAEVGRDLQGSRPPGVLLTHLLDLDGERFQRAAVIAQLPQLPGDGLGARSEEHTSELQSRGHLVCRLLLEKKNQSMNTP